MGEFNGRSTCGCAVVAFDDREEDDRDVTLAFPATPFRQETQVYEEGWLDFAWLSMV
jgi:hypothetical protein